MAFEQNRQENPMQSTRRGLVFSAGAAGLPCLLAGAARSEGNASIDAAVTDLVQRSEEANAALLRGDVGAYRALITLSDDFTLMSPFGGKPSRGRDITDETWNAISRFFRNGKLKQQVIQAYGSADMVVLALIEHAYAEVGGLPAQDWPLRVTLVYRREDAEWRLAHRHADPLVPPIALERAAALARGS
ncbi:MAG TPA: nuclear transport factor 2 family protein [Bosea sp. (in: a-proteobacteria)]|uniref:YybH family protein n=1 Tax=Bosea sp. (in: a-proteobacteria) TaxID=1871050 RepID=UPI002E12810A|nr:nuclear transport factor 2 family protein [Bosea sp. (in: a-proteobacteria)]